MCWQHWILTPFDTAGDLKQFGKTNLTIMGKTVDEFTHSLKDLQGLGIRGIWDAFINGSTEAADDKGCRAYQNCKAVKQWAGSVTVDCRARPWVVRKPQAG